MSNANGGVEVVVWQGWIEDFVTVVTQSMALKRELAIKALSRQEKESLI